MVVLSLTETEEGLAKDIAADGIDGDGGEESKSDAGASRDCNNQHLHQIKERRSSRDGSKDGEDDAQVGKSVGGLMMQIIDTEG